MYFVNQVLIMSDQISQENNIRVRFLYLWPAFAFLIEIISTYFISLKTTNVKLVLEHHQSHSFGAMDIYVIFNDNQFNSC